MFVTNWISTTKIQKISEITNFFRHYFLSRTEVPMAIFNHFVRFLASAQVNNFSAKKNAPDIFCRVQKYNKVLGIPKKTDGQKNCPLESVKTGNQV